MLRPEVTRADIEAEIAELEKQIGEKLLRLHFWKGFVMASGFGLLIVGIASFL